MRYCVLELLFEFQSFNENAVRWCLKNYGGDSLLRRLLLVLKDKTSIVVAEKDVNQTTAACFSAFEYEGMPIRISVVDCKRLRRGVKAEELSSLDEKNF